MGYRWTIFSRQTLNVLMLAHACWTIFSWQTLNVLMLMLGKQAQLLVSRACTIMSLQCRL